MVTPVYSQKRKEVLDSILLEIPGVKAGKAFNQATHKETTCQETTREEVRLAR